MDSMNTVLGWAVVAVAGGGLYYYYTNQDRRRRPFQGRGVRVAPPRAAASPPPSEARPSRDRRREEKRITDNEGQSSGAEARRRQNRPANPVPQVQATRTTVKDDDKAEDNSWARELADRKKGTTLAAPTRADSRQKTVKQGQANKAAELTPASSTTGADADDDLSPAVSPSLPAEISKPLPDGKDVSDMLEPVAPGPKVLNITEPSKPISSKPKQQPRAAPEQETKKQRQNRKKVEERKAQREADEKARRDLEERQRRTAREARGEPARNGLAAAKAPTSNAWKASNHVAAAPIPATNGQLLDTFANDTTSTESTAPTSGDSSPVNGSKWWSGHLPSEEEQERLLKEQDESSWNTVVGKKSKKKVKSADSIEDDSSDTPNGAPAVQAPVHKENAKAIATSGGNGAFSALHDEDEWKVA